jgi:cysteine desulfurase
MQRFQTFILQPADPKSDNWALKATAEAYASKGNHIITSKIEHHAILHTCEYLEKHGFEVTYVDVDEDGILKLDELKKAIRPTTILITIMFANNENRDNSTY